ncbi:MAG TPA: DNA-3-methyladenine glycosylase I [Candidatus Sulfomarinibacteraceae bacterium]|nr:DNA-3-methyladenine glycosylase I [Candidatus Sulfomarinibacteraceae bacterium]
MAEMLNIKPGEVPENDAGYLEMMTKVIFMGGLNRQVVESKWDGFLSAFEEFDPAGVASFTEEDVERLSEDERIVRYGAKIRAVVKNAGRMVEIADEHGSFGQWLRSSVRDEGVDDTARALSRHFSYVSEESARRYLYAVGEDVGEVTKEVRRKYGPGE